MKLWVGIAILASACTINGKSYGPGTGGGGNTSSGGGSTASSPAPSGTGSDPYAGGRDQGSSGDGDKYRGARRYGYGPADPWLVVDGEQPKLLPHDKAEYWKVRGDDYDCSAAHDHCLEDMVWFTIRKSDLERGLPKPVAQNIMGTEGNDHLYGAVNGRGANFYGGDAFSAYRTVPATKTNIAVGSLVVALDRKDGKLRSASQAHEATWWLGEVEEIDLEGGFYKLKDRDDVFKLWGARPVVLMWQKGGKVQIVGNKKRDQLAVKPADTFVPE